MKPARIAASHGQVWADAQGRVPPKVGDVLKIVWRLSGKGPLHVTFAGPDERQRPLDFGPDHHVFGSNLRAPGDEWGTGFAFDAPGCWTIRLVHSRVTATIRLKVV
jgi:hypothetical protein